MEPTISLNNFHLKLGDKLILDNISLDFHSSELTILLGPNGTGKSSLLKLITKEWPSTGEVRYFGQDSSQWKPADLAKHLGVLPQSSTLTFNFSVREVIELGGLTLKASQKEVADIASQYMSETDVLHLADRLYPSLSGGEKQRVHLARVLTQLAQSKDKKVLLLDEPTSALDLSHQHKTLALAKSLTQEGASVITVMHDLNLAAQYADRILILNEGKLVADGNPWDTLTKEKIAEVYQWPAKIIAHPERGHPVILT
ncbi:heme ABC transporter ATP-binding protein [Vibrio sp. TH_r3]|uniref:heme ABC transporter ATP-binding protein n=1 Tax=Vibrio sp. TH_r3 TaxID=3082084 RepID=UPI002952B234|nr:heme ABC transporter ATP-binding protein [Vibrio sp. TH_r3]MDV7103972.1 heme ABC transporter ATP-binding protein [Vibrio sp. TH_r3]